MKLTRAEKRRIIAERKVVAGFKLDADMRRLCKAFAAHEKAKRHIDANRLWQAGEYMAVFYREFNRATGK